MTVAELIAALEAFPRTCPPLSRWMAGPWKSKAYILWIPAGPSWSPWDFAGTWSCSTDPVFGVPPSVACDLCAHLAHSLTASRDGPIPTTCS